MSGSGGLYPAPAPGHAPAPAPAKTCSAVPSSRRRVKLVDGMGRTGRTAPIPPPSSRQTSMEVQPVTGLVIVKLVL